MTNELPAEPMRRLLAAIEAVNAETVKSMAVGAEATGVTLTDEERERVREALYGEDVESTEQEPE